MASVPDYNNRLPGAFSTPGVSSFATFLTMAAPQLLPNVRELVGGAVPPHMSDIAPHGTTIVAATYADGVVMAGDRRATMGNMISMRDMEKVFPADPWSMVGIAGTAGLATELIRLYQVELEHYEKLEGVPLSLKGKAHRLASMIRGNLGMAMQGLAVIPLFAGYDSEERPNGNAGKRAASKKHASRGGRIFSYDVTGSMHEESDYHAVGSGSIFARSALKKLYVSGASEDEAVRMCVEALYDAADDDSATGGPDVARGLYPTVLIANAEGVRRVAEQDLEATATAVIEARKSNPGG